MGSKDLRAAASPPGHQPSASAADASSQSGVPNAQPLYALPREQWHKFTGRSWELPTGKGASDPFLYSGGPAPVPNGTKISVWSPESHTRHGYWFATSASQALWQDGAVVFRIRNVGAVQPTPTPLADPTLVVLERIAVALERIAETLP